MQKRYLIRLDDACPRMDRSKWSQMELILDKYGIKPLVGIIPNNEDPDTCIDSADNLFWEKTLSWERKGWSIALHGFNHVCTSNEGMNGINPFWKRSEFAGLPLSEQKFKIREGIKILNKNGLFPKYFFAPSHTFDKNTLRALAEESNIRIISDTIATKPYKYSDFIFVPQLGGHCFNIPFPGLWTFCFHPSVMDDNSFTRLEIFLKAYSNYFVSFEDIDLTQLNHKNIISKILSLTYFTYRKLRGIR